MVIFNICVLIGAILCSLLVVLYTAALVRVIRGSRYKLIIWIISLLLASNLFDLGLLAGNYKVYWGDIEGGTSTTLVWDWVQAACQMLTDLTFCEAHWIFACYYFKVANNIDMLPEAATRWMYNVFWFGAFLNAIFPIGEGVSGVFLTIYYDNTS